MTIFCLHCREVITNDEMVAAVHVNDHRDSLHRECMLRMVSGSVTHIRGECTAQGGDLDCHQCEEGMTPREAARAAWREYQLRDPRRTQPEITQNAADC